MRCRIEQVCEGTILVMNDEGQSLRVQLAHTPFARLLQTSHEGDTLNIIGGDVHRGVLTPMLVVLEPDQLVDVTTLCSCLRPYGFNAFNSLLNRYEWSEPTWQIQLGNMANDFFDACVNEPQPTFRSVVARSFCQNALMYSSIDGIDAGFFYDAQQQFGNIHRTVRETLPSLGVLPEETILEPQFLSPELGLQGRMDALAPSAIIELKSGKADEFHGGRPKNEHELQMTLYHAMLQQKGHAPRRNMLFYSRYPKLLPVQYTPYQLQTAIAVRNDMVTLERATRDGRLPSVLDSLTEADFNTEHDDGKLYTNYYRPVIQRFLARMQSLPPLERAYFHTFAQFISREQHASKEQFANIWRTPLAAQEAEGTAVTGLTLQPIEDMEGSIVELRCHTDHDLSAINFRLGDSVMLFEQLAAESQETERRVAPLSSQVFRCQIVGLAQYTIHLALAYKQRSSRVFNATARYAMTPAYMESTFMHAYRSLTAIVTAPAERRALLLGQQRPDSTSQPYFLLVGPPGTGKTNVHLRGMVRRYLAEGQTLLIMAYTNQAVDEICGVLEDECPTLYTRIGNENSCAAPYRRRMVQSLTASAANRQQIRALLDTLRVVCGTIASIQGHQEIFRLKRFDTTIVDEASQVLEPQILPILCRVGRFILIGDHKQLPAVVVQDRAECEVTDPLLREIGLTNCANSYFERLYALQEKWGLTGTTTATLDRQGRMHEELMPFVNRHFYGGILKTVPLPHQTATLPYAMPRRLFIDSATVLGGSITGKTNLAEATIVAQQIARIEQMYEQCGLTLNPAKSIGVIVPFRAQIAAIRNLIADRRLAEQITIDTVERYQGSQRDIIIFCTVVTRPDQLDMISTPISLADGTEVDRKLNVALTRAREQLIVVGHRPTLMRSSLYAALVDWLCEPIKQH